MAAMHEQTFECGGQFLSLEAWQANGFDAEAIITNTEANDKYIITHVPLKNLNDVQFCDTDRDFSIQDDHWTDEMSLDQ